MPPNCFSFLGWHEHEDDDEREDDDEYQDEARKNIDNYFSKVFAKRLEPLEHRADRQLEPREESAV